MLSTQQQEQQVIGSRTGMEYSMPFTKLPFAEALCTGSSVLPVASCGITAMPQLFSSCTTSCAAASAAAASAAARALTAASELYRTVCSPWSFPHS